MRAPRSASIAPPLLKLPGRAPALNFDTKRRKLPGRAPAWNFDPKRFYTFTALHNLHFTPKRPYKQNEALATRQNESNIDCKPQPKPRRTTQQHGRQKSKRTIAGIVTMRCAYNNKCEEAQFFPKDFPPQNLDEGEGSKTKIDDSISGIFFSLQPLLPRAPS